MAEQRWIFSLLSILLVTLRFECLIGKEIKVPVGIVLDQNSTVGEMAENFMAMAISDFYAANDNYQTRLSLIKRDSRGDVVSAASAGNFFILVKRISLFIFGENISFNNAINVKPRIFYMRLAIFQ